VSAAAPAPASVLAARPGTIKIAVLPLDCGPGVNKELAGIITEALASGLAQRPDLEVTSHRDVAARIGFERQRQLLGDTSGCGEKLDCMTEIGNALGVDRLAFGSIARLGDSAVLNTTIVELRGSKVTRHTERVKNGSEEAFLDAIAPSIAALFPSPGVASGLSEQVTREEKPSEFDGTHLAVTLRGELSALNLTQRLGAWVVHVDYELSPAFSLGLGAVIARPLGLMVRGTWVPFNQHGRVRPLVSVEVPVFFAASAPVVVGAGASLGFEVRLIKQLAVGLEVPASFYFTGNTQKFWLFGAATATGRF
jgi:hypothetical protein